MSLELRKYAAHHMADLITLDKDKLKFAVDAENGECAYSAFKDGICIGCAGLMRVTGKQFYVWAVVSDELRKHRLWFHRTASKYFMAWLKHLDWLRIEALVDAENERNCRWVKRLGFEFENRKVRGGEDGGDALVYRMVK